MKISAIITCAGKGERMGLGYNKLRYTINGLSIFEYTLSKFLRDDINNIVITSSKEDISFFEDKVKGIQKDIKVVEGGDTRKDSVHHALCALDKDTDIVIIHDGARPFVTKQILDEAIDLAINKGNAVACTTLVDSIRENSVHGYTAKDRSNYLLVQTPQVFKYDSILRAYALAQKDNNNYLDDASIYEKYIGNINISKGDKTNIKITTIDDLRYFVPLSFTVGVGWDTHELVEGRKLILGGVEIPHTKGLMGHSDADVLTHAIMDALLSAAHQKDIGHLFPDTDERYKGICSLLLLKEVVKILKDEKYIINNISAVIMAQKPKLGGYLDSIQKTLADTMGIDDKKITLTATTTEKLGLIGHEEAISVNAYCSLIKE